VCSAAGDAVLNTHGKTNRSMENLNRSQGMNGSQNACAELQNRPQTFNDHLRFPSGENRILPQLTFPLGRLTAQNVAAASGSAFHLAARCDLKPLRKSFVRFLFRHDSTFTGSQFPDRILSIQAVQSSKRGIICETGMNYPAIQQGFSSCDDELRHAKSLRSRFGR